MRMCSDLSHNNRNAMPAMSTNITRTTRVEARIAPDDLMLIK